MHPKIDFRRRGAKRDATGGVASTKSGAISGPFPAKNQKNGIQKGIQKTMPKKYRKMMPKGSQKDAKMDAKIMIFQVF